MSSQGSSALRMISGAATLPGKSETVFFGFAYRQLPASFNTFDMSKKAASIELEARFNATSVQSAQNRKLLQSWLSGLTDQYPGHAKDEVQIEQEQKGVFTLEPEM